MLNGLDCHKGQFEMFAMRCRNVDNFHVVVTQELLVGIIAFADPEVATESDRAILRPGSNRHDSLVRIVVQRVSKCRSNLTRSQDTPPQKRAAGCFNKAGSWQGRGKSIHGGPFLRPRTLCRFKAWVLP